MCEIERRYTKKLNYLRFAVKGLPWAKNSVSNITTHMCEFSHFATSLRERLQIEEDFSTASGDDLTHHTAPTLIPDQQVLYQRYIHNPRDLKKQCNSRQPSNSFTKTPFPPEASDNPPMQAGTIPFEEARRRKVCVPCQQPWKAGR